MFPVLEQPVLPVQPQPDVPEEAVQQLDPLWVLGQEQQHLLQQQQQQQLQLLELSSSSSST